MPYDRDVCIINLAYKTDLKEKKIYKVNAAIVSVHETKYASRLTKIKEKKTERTDYLVVIREIVTGRSAAALQLDCRKKDLCYVPVNSNHKNHDEWRHAHRKRSRGAS